MSAAIFLPDFTGHIIDERYELIKMLGSGSFGVVYKAIDHEVAYGSDGYNVAVKIISKAGRSDDELALIQQEVAFHSVVAHNPGVVTLIDAFDDSQYCYIILECGGGDLFEQIMYKKSYVGNDELLRWAFLSLVDAVQACHDAGIAHRDLKPENVLTSEDGSECYLADFGLATDNFMVWEFGVGTPAYKSPECIGEISEQPYDPYLSDVWALGVILVNMVTGATPWEEATPRDPCFHQFLRDPRFLIHSYPMSEGAYAIIMALLYVAPEKRISLDVLREAIHMLDTFFRPPPQFARVVLEHEQTITTTGPAAKTSLACATESSSGSEYEYESMTPRAPAFDIPCAAAEPDVQVARDCSAGSAVDSYCPSTTSSSSSSSSSSCSSLRASSVGSDEEYVPTPEGSTGPNPMWDPKEARGHYEGWQTGATAQILMAQYRCRQVQSYDDVY